MQGAVGILEEARSRLEVHFTAVSGNPCAFLLKDDVAPGDEAVFSNDMVNFGGNQQEVATGNFHRIARPAAQFPAALHLISTREHQHAPTDRDLRGRGR